VVKYGHVVPTRRIVVAEAGHPVPDRSGQRAAARLCAMAAELGRRDLLIVLLSGGASSLLPAPVAGVTLADKNSCDAERVSGKSIPFGNISRASKADVSPS
jgi:glycerate-2-kinase